MDVDVSRDGDASVIVVTGELDLSNTAALQISHLSPRVAEVLRLTAVDQLFDIPDA